MKAFVYPIITILLILSSFLISNHAAAQESFAEGYIITLNNDTLRGYLEIMGEKHAARSCNFKISPNAQYQKYDASQIRAYRFDAGRFMISKTIDNSGKAETVFLEFLIQGKANLYQHPGDKSTRYFLETESNGLVELSEPERIIHNDSGAFYNIPKYKGKLLYLMADCPEIREDIQQTPLRPKPMIKLANKYHDLVCTDEECVIFERRYKKIEINPSVYSGITFKKIIFGAGLYSDYTPAINAGLSIQLRNLFTNNEKLSLESGLQLMRLGQTTLYPPEGILISEHVKVGDKNYYINNREESSIGNFSTKVFSLKTDLELMSLTIPLVMKYNYQKGNLRGGFGAGPLVTFNIYESKDIIYTYFNDRFGRNVPLAQAGFTGCLFFAVKTSQRGSFELDARYVQELMAGDINKLFRFRSQIFQTSLRYNFFW